MAVRHENIRKPVEIEIEEEAAESQRQEARLADPGRGRVVEQTPPLVVVQSEHLVGEVAYDQALAARAVVIGRVDPHRPARLSLLAEGDTGAPADLLERAVVPVVVQEVRLCIVGDREIGPAVAVVVQSDHAERLAGRVVHAGGARHVLERPVTLVAEQPVGRATIRFGSAVRFAVAVEGAEDVVLRGPLHVVAHEQVQPPVAIVVDPGGARAERGVRHARLLRHVRERAVAPVVEQPVRAKAVDEQVGVPVVVIIGRGHADAIHLDGQTGLCRHVLERAVAAVAVQRLGRLLPPLLGPLGGVDEEQVRVAVPVVVEKRQPRAHRLGQVLLPEGTAVLRKGDPGGARDVGKDHRRARRRRGGRRLHRGFRRVAASRREERRDGQEQGARQKRAAASSSGDRDCGAGAHPPAARPARGAGDPKRLACSWIGWRSRFCSGLRRRYGPVIAWADSSALKRV